MGCARKTVDAACVSADFVFNTYNTDIAIFFAMVGLFLLPTTNTLETTKVIGSTNSFSLSFKIQRFLVPFVHFTWHLWFINLFIINYDKGIHTLAKWVGC